MTHSFIELFKSSCFLSPAYNNLLYTFGYLLLTVQILIRVLYYLIIKNLSYKILAINKSTVYN